MVQRIGWVSHLHSSQQQELEAAGVANVVAAARALQYVPEKGHAEGAVVLEDARLVAHGGAGDGGVQRLLSPGRDAHLVGMAVIVIEMERVVAEGVLGEGVGVTKGTQGWRRNSDLMERLNDIIVHTLCFNSI